MKEAVKSFPNQVLAISGQLLQELLFSFLDWLLEIVL